MRLTAERTEAENLFETLSSKSPVGICIIQDGKFCYTNPAFQLNTSYREDELLGRDSLEIVFPEDREHVRENTIKMMKGKLTLPYKFRVTRKDGSIRWVIESVASVQYRGRRATLGNFVDITEQKQAEEALQAEKNKLQSLIDTMEDSITIRDRDYNLIYMAEHVKKLWGDRTGEKCYRVLEGRDKVCDGCPVEKAFSDGKSHTSERKTVIAGKVAFWENTANPIRDSAGKIVSCLELARDITEHKRAEDTLQAEKNKLQSLVDAMDYTLTIQDAEYNIIYQNEPSRIASGGDHRGEKCYRAYEGRETVCDGCPVEEAFKDGKSHTAERKTVIAGKVAFWENTANPIRDATGKITSCLELARDITEHKQAEEELRESKERFQNLAEGTSDWIWEVDTDGVYTYANPKIKDLLGYEPEEVIGKTPFDLMPLDEATSITERFRDIVESQRPFSGLENTNLHKDGRLVVMETSGVPFFNADRQFCGYRGIDRDITERKKQEQALADELTQRRLLIDKSLDGIVVLDVDARVVEANQRFADMLGYTLEEVYKLHTWDWDKNFPPEQILEMGRNVDEKGLHLETKHTRKDGSVIDVDISISGIMCGGQKLIFCIGRDITERKRAKETLQAEKNKLQSVIDAMADDLTIQDAEYNIIYQNEPARISSGGDHVGEKCYRVYESRESICENCPVEKAFKDGKPHSAERQQVLPSGEVTFWENTANPIKDAKGRAVSCLEIGRNITEHKRAEDTLQAEKNKLQSLIDAMEDGLTIQDRDYNIVYQNEPLKEIFGDRLGEKCYRVYASKDKVCNGCPVAIAFRDGKSHAVEKEVTLPSGKVASWEPTANPIRDANGKIVSCLEIIRDITERKKQEQALADELTRRRLLVDQSLDGIVVINENDKVYEANQRFAEMLGYTPEEVRELHTWDWDKNFPPEEIHELGSKADEKGFLLETTHTRKDGSVIDVDISINASMFGGEKLIFCVCRDVTERKKAEQALADELTQRRLLIDQSLDGIVVLDEDARVRDANQRFAEMLGYTLEEVHELHTWDWDKAFPPEKILEMGRNVDEKGLHLETKHTRKDGSVFDVDISISGIMCGGQKLIFCIGRDITERKQAEEAIKHAAEEWRETFDSITDAISIHDRDYKILRVNKAFADIFHKKPSQILGRYCYELHKGDKPISGCPHKQTLATKKPATAEFYEPHMEKYFQESTSPIFDEKGEVVGTVHITRDITEQKQQNEQLMMADRLASIGELAAGTAHELNNPLTSVIGFSQLLMEKDIPDDLREDLNIIYNEAQRAAGVTKNLLAFARKHAPVKQLNQINNIIEDVLKLRAYEQKVNGIEVERQLAPALPEIRVDYFQIQQVFLNVIINAEYFMTEVHKRGTLTITTKKQNGTVRISIADDGPGISKENLSRIFNPFFTTKEAGKGTGLGLSICHGIVAEHGGQIYARNQQGKGATIFIELPINGVTDHTRGTP